MSCHKIQLCLEGFNILIQYLLVNISRASLKLHEARLSCSMQYEPLEGARVL